MDLKNLVNDDLGCLPHGGELREGDKVSGLRKAINDGENYRVSPKRGKTCDEV